jgi:hypothetical protein
VSNQLGDQPPQDVGQVSPMMHCTTPA